MMESSSRRKFLAAPLLGFTTSAYARYVEPTWIERTDRECVLSNLTRPVALVHLSDFHASEVVPMSHIERAIDMAIDASPDLICMTGDFITHRSGFDPAWYTKTLSRLARKAPTFAVLGNHDGGSWAGKGGGHQTTTQVRRMLENSGAQVLINRTAKLTCNGATLQMVGVGDLWAGEIEPAQAFEHADPALPTVLLSHNPDSKALLGDYAWDLMLCGHTHGGQVVVPVVGLNPAPVRDREYIAGLKPWNGRRIHISRGIGSIRGIRFNCRPEVTKLHLLPKV